ARQGLVLRGLVLHRHRPRPRRHRALHAPGALRVPARPRPALVAPDGLILEVEGLSKHFGALRALSGVSFSVRPGEIFSVIGPNGAGKSTLFNVVSGLHTASQGRVRFDGEDVTGLAPEVLNRRGMAKTFQITNVFPGVTVDENVRVAAQSRAAQSGRLSSLWRSAMVDTQVSDLPPALR